ncbi:MAG: lycopene cyclase family protein [Thermodesulfobacteriota bacterium]
MTAKWFAAIIGGGPAGGALALRLSEAGARILVFDGSHPREKPCGGGFPGSLDQSWPFLRDFPEKRWFQGDRYYTTEKDRTFVLRKQYNSHPQVYVSRRSFDRALLRAAADRGARWVQSHAIHISRSSGRWMILARNGETYTADFLVGADGAKSLVRQIMMGPFAPKDLILAAGCRFPGASLDRLHSVILPGGLAGFLVPGFSFAQAMVAGRPGSPVNRAVLDSFISRHAPFPGKREYFGGLLPMASGPRFFDPPRSDDRTFLIGDAAGFCNAQNGEGLPYAVEGALAAAEALQSGRPGDYEPRWRETFGRELIQGARKAGIKPPDFLMEGAAMLLGRSDALTALAHRVARGTGPQKPLEPWFRVLSRVPREMLFGPSEEL